MQKAINILKNPIFDFFVVLLLAGISFSGKISMVGSYILLSGAWFIGLYGIHQSFKPKKKWYLILTVLLFTIGMLLLAIWIYPEKFPQNEGVLLFSSDGTANLDLEIGDSGSIFGWEGKKKEPLFQISPDDNIIIEKIDKKLAVSTRIRNKEGNQIAEIIRNEWKVAPPPEIWDRNYSDDAFELKDSRGIIVLQVIMLPDRIRLQGEWWISPTQGTRLVSLGKNKGGAIEFLSSNNELTKDQIKPIFLYPSESHFGERINNDNSPSSEN